MPIRWIFFFLNASRDRARDDTLELHTQHSYSISAIVYPSHERLQQKTILSVLNTSQEYTIMTNVVICSIARTPIAKFRGSLSSFKGSELGSIAIRGALAKLLEDVTIREAYFGNVVSAGMGQAPGE